MTNSTRQTGEGDLGALRASRCVPGELVERLEVVRADHLRLASWNRGKDRPARVAFHHDAAQAIAAILKATTASSVGTQSQGDGVNT